MGTHWVYGLNEDDVRFVTQAATIEDLSAATASCLVSLGLRYMTYHLVKITGYGDNLPTLFSNYSQDWISRYTSRGYAKTNPVLRVARASSLPFRWRDLPARGVSEAEQRMLTDAAAHGLTDGYSVPIHFPRGFALFIANPDAAERNGDAVFDLAGQAVATLAFRVHERACALMEQRVLIERSVDPHLTPRELDCVRWLAAGHSAAEIAHILAIAPATVSHHLRRAARRLNAANSTHLCVRAVTLGLIDPV